LAQASGERFLPYCWSQTRSWCTMRVTVLSCCAAGAAASAGSPVTKVIELLGSLAAKVTKEGDEEGRQYDQFVEWCEDNAKSLQHELSNAESRKEELAASIEKSESDIEEAETEIGELSESIAEAEKDLERATQVRTAQHNDWVNRNAELSETIDTLSRALALVKKNVAGLTQVDVQAVSKVTNTLTVLLDGTSIANDDKAHLQAFLQSASEDQDEPKGGMNAIIEILNDMLEKAGSQRSSAEKAETEAKFNFEMVKQSLNDKIKHDNKSLGDTKHRKASASEELAVAQGDLGDTDKDHAADSASLQTLQTDCMVKASDHEASVKERSEELKALAAAKKVIEDKTGGASSRAYGLLQVSSRSDDVSEVARMIRHLGRQQKDFALGLLSTQISSAAQSSQGADVFAKIKGLIEKMIQRLLDDAKAEAGHKAYCDKEMAETEAKKAEHEEDIEHLSSKIKRGESSKAKLTAEIAELEAELGQIAQSQKEMDSQRSEEHAAYVEAKADYEQGVEGVQMAIKVLKEYYGGSSFVQQPEVSTHSAASGESSGIIGLLEVAESDFSKLLAETEADEKDSEDSYDKQTKANKIAKAEKETSAKYKTKELKDTEAELAELSGDRTSEQSELDAVLDYYSSIKKQCVAKPDSYEERKGRREAEINGLKDALDILESQGVGFLSVKTSASHLRR